MTFASTIAPHCLDVIIESGTDLIWLQCTAVGERQPDLSFFTFSLVSMNLHYSQPECWLCLIALLQAGCMAAAGFKLARQLKPNVAWHYKLKH